MNAAALTPRLVRSFAAFFICAALCMGSIAGLAVYTLRTIAAGQRAHAESFVPAKRFTAGFEREMLNARIFFIYFVTIQKPGSLDSGWKRYHNAEATLKDMATLIDKHPDLGNLRAPVAKLREDVANYGVALTATLGMVQGGELKGPHYDAQVKEWAARGATMVTDAASVESLCFRSSEANTNDIAGTLKNGQTRALLLFAACLLLSLVLTFSLLRSLTESLSAEATVGAAASTNRPAGRILDATAH